MEAVSLMYWFEAVANLRSIGIVLAHRREFPGDVATEDFSMARALIAALAQRVGQHLETVEVCRTR